MIDANGFLIENGVLIRYTGQDENVVMPDGVKRIGRGAFRDCTGLKSITIPNGVEHICEEAFWGCCGLKTVTLPDGLVSIREGAFDSCDALTDVTLPDSVKYMGDAVFANCSSLTGITIPYGVTDIGDSMFVSCEHLTGVTLPDSVTGIGAGAFNSCIRLTDITLPDSVTHIGGWAFRHCSSLTNVVIPCGVKRIEDGLFEECRRLTHITIPEGATDIGIGVFAGCGGLTDITCASAFVKKLRGCLPETKIPIALHISDTLDISSVSHELRPGVAVGFAEDGRDCTDENGRKCLKYIKTNAAKLAQVAVARPVLFYLMLCERLITAEDLETVTNTVQKSGNTELIAAILDYGNRTVSEKDKARVQRKKEEREAEVTNFLFDTEAPGKLRGKTFAVTGKLKTFTSRDALRECLENCGAGLAEKLSGKVDYLITNIPDTDTEKNGEAVKLQIKRITEQQFNEMIGRNAGEKCSGAFPTADPL